MITTAGIRAGLWAGKQVHKALGRLRGGQEGPGMSESAAMCGPGPEEQAEACEVDFAQYDWLVGIFTRAGGLSEEQAQELLCMLAPDTLHGAMVTRDNGAPEAAMVFAPETAETDAGDTVPDGVHLGTHASNRAYMLDWDSRHATLSPEAVDGTDRNSTMREVFEAHREAQIRSIFGDDANLSFVQSAIELADAAGRADVAAELRAGLFRANQYAVVESLNVEDSQRYAPGGGNTYCNIYAHDVVSALGGYLPRTWWYPAIIQRIQRGERTVTREEYARMQSAGEDVRNVIRPDYGVTVREMNANSLNAWMREWGTHYGWQEAADANEAQAQANSGRVVVILAANANASRSGHVTVVMAEDGDHEAHRDESGTVLVPLQSQAGSSNFKYSDPEQRSGQSSWWNNASHRDGGFWIYTGATQSPLVTPESLGASP